jgi:3-oxoacyl-[acyl-carrier protein] reductase
MNEINVNKPLSGKVALVTGAGRGIGQAIAKAYAAAGACVCCAARSLAEITDTVASIEAAGGTAISVVADVSDEKSVAGMVACTIAEFGDIDILVLNAGAPGDGKTVEEGDADSWRETINVNLIGAYLCARAAIPSLKRNGGGKIITIGSGAGHSGTAAISAYACSKAALWMLTRVLATELASSNVDVNELIPGPVATRLVGTTAADMHRLAPNMGDEWFKTPADVIPIAMFLATQPTRGPTGQSFGLLRRQV